MVCRLQLHVLQAATLCAAGAALPKDFFDNPQMDPANKAKLGSTKTAELASAA